MAKIKKSAIDRQGKTMAELLESGELEKDKIKLLGSEDDYPENIWVAKDKKNKVMYLMNHALIFHPFPSWGAELPLGNVVDALPMRGETFDDLDLTLIEEAFTHMSPWVDSENNFDFKKYLEDRRTIK